MNHRAEIASDEAYRTFEDGVRDAALATLAYEDAPDGGLTVVLADSASLRKLNRQFRQVDAETDVLSFVDGSADPETGETYFGDVVIAVPVAEAQAAASGHAVDSELALLAVHGVLHLLGHDHGSADEKERMWTRQAAILRQLSIKVKLPS
jgi:probable rRNA maturation factor